MSFWIVLCVAVDSSEFLDCITYVNFEIRSLKLELFLSYLSPLNFHFDEIEMFRFVILSQYADADAQTQSHSSVLVGCIICELSLVQLYYDGNVIATLACASVIEREEWLKSFNNMKAPMGHSYGSHGELCVIFVQFHTSIHGVCIYPSSCPPNHH